MSFTTISRRILNEIDKESKNQMYRELAKVLLQFEMENWGTDSDNRQYREFYEAQITRKSTRI